MTIREEIASAVAKLTPPVAVAAADKFSGLTLADWVLILTLIYTLLQIVYISKKLLKPQQVGHDA